MHISEMGSGFIKSYVTRNRVSERGPHSGFTGLVMTSFLDRFESESRSTLTMAYLPRGRVGEGAHSPGRIAAVLSRNWFTCDRAAASKLIANKMEVATIV